MPQPAQYGTSPTQQNAQRRPGLAEAYNSLEALLRASPRGRWFLAEYARRNRTAETDMLLEALARIEHAVLRPSPRQAVPSNVFSDLVEMSEAIARTRREIAQIKPPHQFDKRLVSATAELDHIVEATEKATSDILEAAEEIQEAAWTLRERGTDVDLCDKIDQRATDIYTACSFQDITGQRTGKVVKALRFIEQRLNAMIEIWGVDIASQVDDAASKMQAVAEAMREDPHLLHGPQAKSEGLKQDDVDRMLHDTRTDGVSERARARYEDEPRRFGFSAARGEDSSFEEPAALTVAGLDPAKCAALFG